MLNVKNLNYDSWQTVYFQRASVTLLELLLVYALNWYIKTAPAGNKKLAHAASLSILLSPGLLIIDHIHFQYNGFLYGLLILSILLAREQSTLLYSGITFAALLCFKHIYLYISLAWFVYLLRAYFLDPKSVLRPRFGNIVKLGVSVVGVFAAAFGPFAYRGQLLQLKDRLFPFSRGLCHAYWAPNIWAMYSFVDRALIPVAPRLGIPVKTEALNSVTRGLVGDTTFAILPEITKEHTFLLTFFFQLVRYALTPDQLAALTGNSFLLSNSGSRPPIQHSSARSSSAPMLLSSLAGTSTKKPSSSCSSPSASSLCATDGISAPSGPSL